MSAQHLSGATCELAATYFNIMCVARICDISRVVCVACLKSHVTQHSFMLGTSTQVRVRVRVIYEAPLDVTQNTCN